MNKTLSLLACLALWACTDRTLSKLDPLTEGDGQADAAVGAHSPGAGDAGVAAPGASTCSPKGEKCAPGAARYCDGQTYCNWGVQTCGPDGTWGTCHETSQPPEGCHGAAYDEGCCVKRGYCCQAVTGNASAGTCPGVIPQCDWHHDD